MKTNNIYLLFDLPVIERHQTNDHKTIFVSKEFSLSVWSDRATFIRGELFVHVSVTVYQTTSFISSLLIHLVLKIWVITSTDTIRNPSRAGSDPRNFLPDLPMIYEDTSRYVTHSKTLQSDCS